MSATRWINLFAFLWFVQFLLGCQDFVIAGSVSKWFFTRNKNKLSFPVIRSFAHLIRYHLGSVSLGSLVNAIVQMIQIVFKLIEVGGKPRQPKTQKFTIKLAVHVQRVPKPHRVVPVQGLPGLPGMHRELRSIFRQKRLHHHHDGRLVVLHRWQARLPHSLHELAARLGHQLGRRLCAAAGKGLRRGGDRSDWNWNDSGNIGVNATMTLCGNRTTLLSNAPSHVSVQPICTKIRSVCVERCLNDLMSTFFCRFSTEQTWATLHLGAGRHLRCFCISCVPLFSHGVRDDDRHHFPVLLRRLRAKRRHRAAVLHVARADGVRAELEAVAGEALVEGQEERVGGRWQRRDDSLAGFLIPRVSSKACEHFKDSDFKAIPFEAQPKRTVSPWKRFLLLRRCWFLPKCYCVRRNFE